MPDRKGGPSGPSGHWGGARPLEDTRAGRLPALFISRVRAAVGGWMLWLWWPALSLTMVAIFYAAIGASGFQKRPDGGHSLAARWLLAPYLAGAWINSRAWTWAKPHATLISDGVWIGRTPTRTELRRSRFASIVDMSPELSLDPGTRAIAVVASLDLNPQKSRVLLRLALLKQRNNADLQRLFGEY